MGFSCLVYRACLTASNNELHEAAKIDGAGLFKRILYIDLLLCRSAFLVNLIFQIGGILNINTERALLFKNTANSAYSTTLDLYEYELTFKSTLMPAYSKAMALSLMLMSVNFLLLMLARKAAVKVENIYA
ncbi:MAG: hypothetical protein IKW08_00915 [Roseburia sp.]|nr:hypothetical protein [Roseburia sp.]